MVHIKDLDELTEIAKKIIDEAKKQGAEQAQVNVFSNENIATRFGENHITQNTQSNILNFNLISQIGSQVGIYSGTAADLEKLPKMIGHALDLVKYSPPDPDFPGFVEERQSYNDFKRSIIEYDALEIADTIKSGIDAATNQNSKIEAVAGSINYNASRTVLMNSYNLFAEFDSSAISGIMNIAARENGNESRSSESVAGVNINDLKMEKTGELVAERAIRGLDQGELDMGSYETILGTSAMTELMYYLAFLTSSNYLINQQSAFIDKLGEKLFDERLTITDDVEDPTHYSSRKYDSDGLPCKSIKFIEDGILKDFAYSRRNAKKLGVETNARAAGGMGIFATPVIQNGNKSEEELIESIDNGVYISNFWYINFSNMSEGVMSGLTRDGLFKIENGEIVGSLKNMRFTDTFFSMFKEFEPGNNTNMKLGSYGDNFGIAVKTPSIRLGAINFSSKGKH